MTDDFLTRAYVDNHHRMTGGAGHAIAKLIDTIRVSLNWLNAYEFDAPWHHDRTIR